MKRAVLAGGALIALFGLQQALFVQRGDYSRQLVWEASSADGRYRLEARRQASFPAFDILDPEGTAYFAVIATRTGNVVATTTVPLNEIFDIQRPKVAWTATQVEVREFDESHPEAVVRLQFVK